MDLPGNISTLLIVDVKRHDDVLGSPMIIKAIVVAAVLVSTGGALAQSSDTHPMGQSGNPSGPTTPGAMSNDAMGEKSMDHRMAIDDGITMKQGKWLKNGKPATAEEIAAHKQMMKAHEPK